MMQQDQLTKSERLRLESFAQACNCSFTIRVEVGRPSLESLFEHAKKIEAFLKASNQEDT